MPTTYTWDIEMDMKSMPIRNYFNPITQGNEDMNYNITKADTRQGEEQFMYIVGRVNKDGRPTFHQMLRDGDVFNNRTAAMACAKKAAKDNGRDYFVFKVDCVARKPNEVRVETF